MQEKLDKEVSKVGAAMVGTEFTKFKEEKQARFDIQSREFEKYTRELGTETEQRLREAEDRLSRDIRTKFFSLSLAVVISAVGAMVIGSFTATRDVNNSVIALQKDIIAAQTALKTASDALVEQRQKLANAEADLVLATSKSIDARSKLEATTPLLDKARGEYEGLTKATTDARSKLEATTSVLDKARGEYEGLRKATTDARSKLEATTPLLDNARGEYEGLTKAKTNARFISRHVSKLRSQKEVEAAIRRELIERCGERPITDVGLRDVAELVEAIADDGRPYAAHKIFAYASKLFGWALARDVYGLEKSLQSGHFTAGQSKRRMTLHASKKLCRE
jgi:cell division protein FtsL